MSTFRRYRYAAALLAMLAGGWAAPAWPLGVGVSMVNMEARFDYVSMSPPWGSVLHQYRSRNRYANGLGAGWCDAVQIKGRVITLNARLNIGRDSITLQECGSPQELAGQWAFEAKPADRERLAKAALAADQMRAAPMQLYSPERGSLTLTAQEIVFKDKEDVMRARFGWDGRLLGVGPLAVELQADGRIKALIDADQQRLDFLYEGARLVQLKASQGYIAHFRYRADGSLQEVDNAWQKTYGFVFSDKANLQSVSYPDKSQVTLFYDEGRDAVTGLINRSGCIEAYSRIAGNDELHYKVQALLYCDGKKVLERSVTYQFEPDGRRVELQDQILDNKGVSVSNESFISAP